MDTGRALEAVSALLSAVPTKSPGDRAAAQRKAELLVELARETQAEFFRRLGIEEFIEGTSDRNPRHWTNQFVDVVEGCDWDEVPGDVLLEIQLCACDPWLRPNVATDEDDLEDHPRLRWSLYFCPDQVLRQHSRFQYRAGPTETERQERYGYRLPLTYQEASRVVVLHMAYQILGVIQEMRPDEAAWTVPIYERVEALLRPELIVR
jgi:hypothetical protein